MEIRTTRGLYRTAKGFWGDADPASRSNHLSVQTQRTTTRQRPLILTKVWGRPLVTPRPKTGLTSAQAGICFVADSEGFYSCCTVTIRSDITLFSSEELSVIIIAGRLESVKTLESCFITSFRKGTASSRAVKSL